MFTCIRSSFADEKCIFQHQKMDLIREETIWKLKKVAIADCAGTLAMLLMMLAISEQLCSIELSCNFQNTMRQMFSMSGYARRDLADNGLHLPRDLALRLVRPSSPF